MELAEFYAQLLGILPPWEVESVRLEESNKSIHVFLHHPAAALFTCKVCQTACPVYDHAKVRTWRHLDTCTHFTYVHAALPRTSCKTCGVHTISPSWSRENSHFTLDFECFIIDTLQAMQVRSRAAKSLRLPEGQVRRIQKQAVQRGLAHRKAEGYQAPKQLGIDEKSLLRGQHYVNILYDGDTGAVLEVKEHRTKEATQENLDALEEYVKVSDIEAVTLDMWQAFTQVMEERLPQAALVYDRFHVSKELQKAVDQIRRAENKQLSKQGDERLKNTRYLWLKNLKNLSESQCDQLTELQTHTDLKTLTAWQLKESFKGFFTCTSVEEAGDFFNQWMNQVEQTGLTPLKKAAYTLERHLQGLLNYIEHPVSNAIAESANMLIQQIKVKARGFASAEAFRNAILFHLGKMWTYP